MKLNSSDRKKLLALPFSSAKRSEMPTPKMGQVEYALFKEMTGMNWNDDEQMEMDEEKKITEFDYENYIHPLLLKKVNTKSSDFKQTIRYLNLTSKTKYEAF